MVFEDECKITIWKLAQEWIEDLRISKLPDSSGWLYKKEPEYSLPVLLNIPSQDQCNVGINCLIIDCIIFNQAPILSFLF